MNILSPLSSRNKEILLILFLFLISFSINLYNWDSLSLFEGRGDISLAEKFTFENFEMAGGYTGTIIFLLIMKAIFGLSLFSVRLASAISIASIVVFVYLLTKEYLGRGAALLTSMMLIMSSVFILTSISEAPYLAFFPVLLTLLFYKYYKTKNVGYLYVCALVSGYSLYHKLINLYFLISLITSFVLVKWIFKIKTDFNLRKKSILLVFLLFIIGLSPIIIHNFIYSPSVYGYSPLLSKINEIFSEEYEGFSFINRLGKRIAQFVRFEHGLGSPISEDVIFFDNHNPIIFSSRFYHFNLLIFVMSSILFLISKDPKKIFLLLLVFLFSFLTIFSPTDPIIAHYLPVQPFLFLIMAGGLITIYKSNIKLFKIKNMSKILFFILIVIFISLNLSYLIMHLVITKDQIIIEETLPTKAIVHHRLVESLEDADLLVMPANRSSSFIADYVSCIYPKKKLIHLCNVLYNEKDDVCSFVYCMIDNSFFPGNKNVKYVLPYLPDRPTYYNLTGYRVKEGGYGLSCATTFKPYNKYNNTNYPLEFLLDEAAKRNKTLRLEKDFVNAHGEIVYKLYSLSDE
ncbi:MAG: hypothetical protein GTN76_07740 [Candidatus Aenigmarchaeota archaeon]|nr:hypothetical protein [Candidatus Aenigmarchaeota archaeon]